MATHPMLSRFVDRMQRQLIEARDVWVGGVSSSAFSVDTGTSGDFLETTWHKEGFLSLIGKVTDHMHAASAEQHTRLIQSRLQALTPEKDKELREQVAYHCAEAALYLGMIADNMGFNRNPLVKADPEPKPEPVGAGEEHAS